MADLSIRKLSPVLGAEVLNVSLTELLDDSTFEAIQKAWYENVALVFRNQSLSAADLVAFSSRFGQLDIAPPNENGRCFVEGFEEILVISNVVENGVAIGSLGSKEIPWHTDMSYTEVPPLGITLYGFEVPAPDGGKTEFVNMYQAFETLSDELKQKVEGLSIKHDSSINAAGYLRLGSDPVIDVVTCPGAIHPIVRTHPVTGRQVLYLGRRRNAYICGLPVQESEELLDALWDHCTQSQLKWHHHWQPGDLLLWDNFCTIHRRDQFDPNSRRILYRTQFRPKLPQLQERAAETATAVK
ncbi:TauD/TfdA family dioxygenase [Leptolyngbya sp. FACHB-261]|uniref:TauD/TfdA dioxygenase family protein n=1 Tax=Leptolyngbya sp. FACHB-261 TaxID=2692806 RepID=UPI0016891821|nr:TauD/TfdA family dioxygenase [Leptolyngbya sp. FACHB-261]MBD2104029.1 TauD/TfdA family dioxygenase [Leptolyngbya sp. FACHB-261]